MHNLSFKNQWDLFRQNMNKEFKKYTKYKSKADMTNMEDRTKNIKLNIPDET